MPERRAHGGLLPAQPRANGVNTVAVYLYGDNGAVTDEVLGKVGETLEKLKEISVDVTVAAAVAARLKMRKHRARRQSRRT